jgi:hypothetical protein
MHTLALILAAASVSINGLAFALSGLFNEPKAGACFGAAAALSLLALFLGYDDVTVLAWGLMAATLAAVAALVTFAISAREDRQSPAGAPASATAPPKLDDRWAYLAFAVPVVVPAAASLAALLN